MDQETALDVVDEDEKSMHQAAGKVCSILDGRRIDRQQTSTVSRLLVMHRLVLSIDVSGRIDWQMGHPSRFG